MFYKSGKTVVNSNREDYQYDVLFWKFNHCELILKHYKITLFVIMIMLWWLMDHLELIILLFSIWELEISIVLHYTILHESTYTNPIFEKNISFNEFVTPIFYLIFLHYRTQNKQLSEFQKNCWIKDARTHYLNLIGTQWRWDL